MATTPLRSQKISRDKLAKFLPTPDLIKAFENLSADVAENIPDSVDGIRESAENALTLANLLRNRSYLVAQTETDLESSRTLEGTRGIEVLDAITPGKVTIRTIDFLSALHLLSGDGFVVRSGVNAEVRSLLPASARVSITDGDGVDDDPTFDVVESELRLQNIGGVLPIAKGGTGSTTFPGFITGDFKQRAAASFPAGWVRANAGTIGNGASGATRANADTQALFTLWWTDYTNADVPIQTSTGAASTRGASAATDYAANKRMTVPIVADAAPLIGAYKL